MSDKVYDVPAEWPKRAYIDEAKYKELYARSVKDPNGFWAEQGKRIDWIKPFSKVKNTSYDPNNVSIKWFEDGTLNVCYNCVDRHLAKRGDQTAILWEGDDPKDYKKLYARSVKDPNGFWAEQGKRIDWIKPFSKVKNTSYDPNNVSIKWFEDGTLNVCYNCVDRHLAKRGDQTAILWEGDDPKEDK